MNDNMSWSEVALLTHKTQVERFGWCSCEDNEGNENPYSDCTEDDQWVCTITDEVMDEFGNIIDEDCDYCETGVAENHNHESEKG